MKWFIYALSDPRDGEVRYVGKTRDPEARYNTGHRKGGNQLGKQRVAWIDELSRQGLLPDMKIVDQCEEDVCDEREFYWMLYFAFKCGNLTNAKMTPGGRYSAKLTKEHRNKIKRISERHGLRSTAVLWLCLEYVLETDFNEVLTKVLDSAPFPFENSFTNTLTSDDE